ncbi:MAG: serine hydrolase [Patescibacteria group bacterium]|jgi:beta-lactamase class A
MRDLHRQQFLISERRKHFNYRPLIVSGVLVLLGVGGWRLWLQHNKNHVHNGFKGQYEELKNDAVTNKGRTIVAITKSDVIQRVRDITQGKQGLYGWFVQSLKTGDSYGENIDFAFTAASVNKVPIMITYLLKVEEGNESLEDIYTLRQADIEKGTGTLQYQKKGTKYTFAELLSLSGKLSDNTAANVLASRVGLGNVQRFVDAQGMVQTNIVKNTTSPKNMGELFSSLYLDKIFTRVETKQLLFEALTNTDFEDRISIGVPKGVVVVHKIGNQIQVWNDCGLILGEHPYSLCILTDGIRESEAQEILPKISEIVWRFENQKRE